MLACMGPSIDYVLLEMELAVELLICGRMTNVFPIFLGDAAFCDNPYSFIAILPNGVPVATKRKLLEVMAERGLEPSDGCSLRSVRETLCILLEHQGMRWDRMDFAEMEKRLLAIL